jgi:hypothetical protein
MTVDRDQTDSIKTYEWARTEIESEPFKDQSYSYYLKIPRGITLTLQYHVQKLQYIIIERYEVINNRKRFYQSLTQIGYFVLRN